MAQKYENQGDVLLVMDIHTSIPKISQGSMSLLKSIERAIEKARKINIPIIYVAMSSNERVTVSNKRIIPQNRTQSDLENVIKLLPTTSSLSISPSDEDIIIIKKRMSAFSGSDLQIILKSLNARHLVLSGYATSGVVLSTVRDAADRDYQITVLSDCCGDLDEEVHNVLIKKVFPLQADVLQTDNWLS